MTQTMEQDPSVKRNGLIACMLLAPLIVSGASWASGGTPFMTDVAMVLLTIICVLAILRELFAFSSRYGIGGLVLYGGTLVWFCHDYLFTWFGRDFLAQSTRITPEAVSKASFCTILFVLSATLGLNLRKGWGVCRLITSVPEPASPGILFVLALILFCIGISPYFIWTTEPFYIAIAKSMTGMRTSESALWTVGRTGNLNYNWGGYVVHILQMGWMAAIIASLILIYIPASILEKLACAGMWLFWILVTFGSGARSYVLIVVFPGVFFIFVKYHLKAAGLLRKLSLRAYLYTGVALLITLALVQFQGTFRTTEGEYRDWRQIDLAKVQGNHMFSEGLLAYQLVPDEIPHPGITFWGSSVLMPIPDMILRHSIAWIPRALWHDKPGIADFNQFYNKTISGGTANNTIGATICTSIVGGAYIYYGVPAVVQTGLVFGWLCWVVETAFRMSLRKPMAMLFSASLATWLFRGFRDLAPHDLHPLLIGMIGASVLLFPFRLPKQEPLPDLVLTTGDSYP